MAEMGYEKESEARVVRTRHKISFRLGSRASEISYYLSFVPRGAKLVEIYEVGNREQFPDMNDYLIFEEEHQFYEKPNPV